jgi:hypothetical protein
MPEAIEESEYDMRQLREKGYIQQQEYACAGVSKACGVGQNEVLLVGPLHDMGGNGEKLFADGPCA